MSWVVHGDNIVSQQNRLTLMVIQLNFVLASIIIGLIVAGVYAFSQARIKRFPKLTNMVVLFMSSGGVTAGVKMCFLAYSSTILNIFIEDSLYIFIGGIAVVYVSIQAILQVFGVEFND